MTVRRPWLFTEEGNLACNRSSKEGKGASQSESGARESGESRDTNQPTYRRACARRAFFVVEYLLAVPSSGVGDCSGPCSGPPLVREGCATSRQRSRASATHRTPRQHIRLSKCPTTIALCARRTTGNSRRKTDPPAKPASARRLEEFGRDCARVIHSLDVVQDALEVLQFTVINL